jgi:hypothetical protein
MSSKPLNPLTLLLLLISVCFISLLISLASGSSFLKAVKAPQQTFPPGTLNYYAQQAQAQGFTRYTFESGIYEYVEPDNWDIVLGAYSFAVVELLETRSYPDSTDGTIGSWQRFRVLETLSQKPLACSDCFYPTPPNDVLPAQPDEILVRKHSGTLQRNGVTLVAKESDFPDFTAGQRYLLIVDLNSSTKVGDLALGPAGAYRLDASNNIACVCDIPNAHNPYQADIASRYNNSLNQLRVALGGNPGPTPTPQPTVDPCRRKPWLCQ